MKKRPSSLALNLLAVTIIVAAPAVVLFCPGDFNDETAAFRNMWKGWLGLELEPVPPPR